MGTLNKSGLVLSVVKTRKNKNRKVNCQVVLFPDNECCAADTNDTNDGSEN